MAATGPTKPEAGVIATRPPTAPMAAAIADGLPFCAHESATQVSAAAAAAVLVTTNALAASAPAASAEPALNPNPPNHRSAAPRITNGMLFAAGVPLSSRFPTSIAAASAEKPAVMCTT